jgi:hypothetical protein
MKKTFFTVLSILILGACSKSSTSSDPYTGTFFIKYTVGSAWYAKNNGAGYMALSPTAEGWKIEASGSQHAIAPVTDLSRIISNPGNSYPTLITRPVTLTNKEFFTFETVPGSNLVNIKSVADNKYIVFQYGLNAAGTIISWGFLIDNKTPCTANFAGAASNGCQYNFELVKQ